MSQCRVGPRPGRAGGRCLRSPAEAQVPSSAALVTAGTNQLLRPSSLSSLLPLQCCLLTISRSFLNSPTRILARTIVSIRFLESILKDFIFISGMESYFVLSTDQMSGLRLVSSLYTDSVLTPDQQITETDTSSGRRGLM